MDEMHAIIYSKNSVGNDITHIQNLGTMVEINSRQLFDANTHEWDYVTVQLPLEMYVESVNKMLNGEKSVSCKNGVQYLEIATGENLIHVRAGPGNGTISNYMANFAKNDFFQEFPKVMGVNYKLD